MCSSDLKNGHQFLWVMGVVTSFLTATYMFRLVHLTFHGEERFAQGHDDHGHAHSAGHHAPAHGTGHQAPAHGHDHGHAHGAPHDAPWPMATALVVLAVGSILAGYIGLPHALPD